MKEANNKASQMAEVRAVDHPHRDESESRYLRIINNLPGVVYSFSNEVGGLYYSPGVEDILGYSPEHLREHPRLWNDSIHPDDLPMVNKAITELQAGKYFDLEYRIRDASGNWLWLHDRNIVIQGENGEIIIDGIADDITARKRTEEEFRNMRAQAETIVEGAADAIISVKEDQTIIAFNKSAENIFGYTKDEAIGESLTLLLPKDISHKHKDYLHKFGHDKPESRWMGQRKTLYALRKSGELFPVEISISKQATSDGVIFTSILKDISRRTQAEKALRESEERFRAFANYTPNKLHIKDTEGRYILINRKTEELFGVTNDEALGKTIDDILPHETASAYRDHDLAVLTTGQSTEQEEVFQEADGPHTYLTVKFPILGADSRIVAVGSSGFDITERKRYEENLALHVKTGELMEKIATAANEAETSEHAMQVALDEVCAYSGWPIGHYYKVIKGETATLESCCIWHLDRPEEHKAFKDVTANTHFEAGMGLPGRVFSSGKPEWINDTTKASNFVRAQCAKKVGIKAGFAIPVMVGKEVVSVLEFYCCEFMEPDKKLMEVVAHVGTQLGRVIERQRSKDELVKYSDHLHEMVDERTAEVSEKADQLERALEREKEYNILQQKFVALVSHEFRTPLTIIDGAAQRLIRRKDKLNKGEVEERANKVRSAVTRMIGLIDTTLYASRLDAGKIDLKMAPCDIGELMLDVCERQSEISPSHQISVKIDDLPTEVLADRRLLDQVFTNLLSNATKYSPDSSLIEIKGWRDEDNALITITDQGMGIPADDLPHMFERFFRAKTAKGIKGTGIGLSVVKEFIQLHGGTVSIDSQEGKGAMFTVRLPIDGSS